MNEVAYTVAVTFSSDEDAECWLRWMRDGHLADVLASGATRAVVVEMEGKPRLFEARYEFPNREAFSAYEREHAPRLRAEGLRLFPVEKGIDYRRTVGIVREVMEKMP